MSKLPARYATAQREVDSGKDDAPPARGSSAVPLSSDFRYSHDRLQLAGFCWASPPSALKRARSSRGGFEFLDRGCLEPVGVVATNEEVDNHDIARAQRFDIEQTLVYVDVGRIASFVP